jgi:hypothetical protein
MLRYRYIRDDLTKEEQYLQKMGQRGYVLRNIRGAKYYFDHAGKDKHYAVRLQLSDGPIDKPFGAQHVTSLHLGKDITYNAIYSGTKPVALDSNTAAVATFHKRMLNLAAKQQWKSGLGLLIAMILFAWQAVLGQSAAALLQYGVRSLVLAASIALIVASVHGMFVGVRNSAQSVHREAPTANN